MGAVFKDARMYFGSVIEDAFISAQSKILDLNKAQTDPTRIYYVDSSAVSARLHFIGRIMIEGNKDLHSLASKVLPEFSKSRKCRFCFGAAIPLSIVEISTLFGSLDKMPMHAIKRMEVKDNDKNVGKVRVVGLSKSIGANRKSSWTCTP